jgi:hypothetical protein
MMQELHGRGILPPFRVYLDRALIFRLFLFSLQRKKTRLVTAWIRGLAGAATKLNTYCTKQCSGSVTF